MGDYEKRGRDVRDVFSDSSMPLFVVCFLKGDSGYSRKAVPK